MSNPLTSSTANATWDDFNSTIPTSAATGRLPLASSSRTTAPAQVKDDWEDDEDEDEEEPPSVERNKQIWEDANTKTHHPMPAVIIARSSAASSTAAHVPPQGVFQQQPAMRILKRPTNTTPSPATEKPQVNALEALKEREARYQAARERIFGTPDSGLSSPSSGTPPPIAPSTNTGTGPVQRDPQPNQVKIAREPRGPKESGTGSSSPAGGQDSSTAKGFGNRRSKAKPPSTTTSPTNPA